jgi:hypothetical protein
MIGVIATTGAVISVMLGVKDNPRAILNGILGEGLFVSDLPVGVECSEFNVHKKVYS